MLVWMELGYGLEKPELLTGPDHEQKLLKESVLEGSVVSWQQLEM